MADLSVLMCTEGTYPFAGGGVSVWCDVLAQSLPQVEYTVLAVMGDPNLSLRFNLPPNVRRIIHVPLWGTQEPAEYILKDVPLIVSTRDANQTVSKTAAQIRRQFRQPVRFSSVYQRKQHTTDSVITAEFIPLLQRFLQGTQSEDVDLNAYGIVLYHLWLYFQKYDWNITWKSEPAWRTFIEEVMRPYESRPHDFLKSEIPTHNDLTTAMRWMYNFLMPLNVQIPPVDIVHSSIASFAGLTGIIAKQHYGTPFLITEHGVSIRERYIAISNADFGHFAKQFLLRMSGLISRLTYHYADVISPVANFNRRWEERYGALPPEKIETIYNGIDPGVFVPKSKPERTANRPTAVAAARVNPLKDIEMMIRSAAVVRESIPNVYFLVYGSLNADPPYVEKCRKLIADLKLEDTFEFGGFHSKPAEIYTEGDISLLSSISEGFPFTVLESMSCARPVVGTDVGGVKEALDGFGVIVPPRDHEAFGAGVVKLLQDDNLRLEMGRKAREEIIVKFQTKDMIKNYQELYLQLAAQKPVDQLYQEIPVLETENGSYST